MASVSSGVVRHLLSAACEEACLPGAAEPGAEREASADGEAERSGTWEMPAHPASKAAQQQMMPARRTSEKMGRFVIRIQARVLCFAAGRLMTAD